MKSIGFVSLLIWSLSVLAQESITLSDIFVKGTFRPEYVWGQQPLPAGDAFSKLVFDRENRQSYVASYAYESGELIDTLIRFSDLLQQADPKPASPFFSYTFSADMSKALVALQEESIYRYSSKANYYVMDLESRTLTPLTEGAKQLYATFSPDGNKVAFVQENDLFYTVLATGEVVRVTDDGEWNYIINGAADWVYEEELTLTRAFEWSPDSRYIAYMRFDESRVKQFDMPVYQQQLYPSDYSFKYPKAGEDNAIVTIHAFDTKKEKGKDFGLSTGDDFYFPRLQWTTDEDVFVVQKLNRLQNRLELLAVDVRKGDVDVLMSEENEFYIDITDNLIFLDNGKQFIWTSEQDGYHHIYLFNMDGTLDRQLTAGAWDVTALYGVDEKGWVYYQSSEVSPLERHVYRINLKGKKKRQLTREEGWHDADFSADRQYYIRTFSSPTQPYHFAVYDNTGEELRLLESNEALKATTDSFGFVEKAFFSFDLEDGTPLNGWMMKPADFDTSQTYPVFMFVYGGPGSQTVQKRWASRNDFWFQYLTQLGYIVVSVDNRGTGARGEAFKKVTYKRLGVIEVEDQIAAARHLAELPYIDGERIGIFGWSYGGYMSSGCLFRAPDLFKMAIAVAPVTHWKFYDTIYTERFMQTPQENPDGYEAGSPINYVDGLQGKFLLIHGTGDDNVHFQNTVELTRALVEAGKQFDVFFYPDKNHGIPGSTTRLHLYKQMTDYIQENL